MHFKLKKSDYQKALPLAEGMPKDPMMHTVIEGHQAGQVLADHPEHPTAALIWGGMEYAYLVGENAAAFIPEVKAYVENVILSSDAGGGLGFVSVFSPDEETRQALLEAFEERSPVSYGVNGYVFDAVKFRELAKTLKSLPDGYSLIGLDREALVRPALKAVRDDLAYCWETIERFLELGLGFAVMYDGKPASSCYTIGFGAEAYHITISTWPDFRRRGLARQAVAALIRTTLERGKTVYWLNDSPNTASRRLAESLGFSHTGDLYPVDIPAEPGRFHCGLAGHFAGYLKDSTEAEKLYHTALCFNPEDEGELAGIERLQNKD
jgi:RimJ/RimL family protein N-acetyltransferase